MSRLDELLAAYPPPQRSELERELAAEVERLRAPSTVRSSQPGREDLVVALHRVADKAFEEAAQVCDAMAAGPYRLQKREEGVVAAQLAAAIRSCKRPI